jgi:Fe-S cluster assembly protein SufD
MVELLEKTGGLIEAAEAILSKLPEDAGRRAAFERFRSSGLPTHKDEEWKYTSLRLIAETAFGLAPAASHLGGDICDLPVRTDDGIRLVLKNGVFVPELSGTPSDVRVRAGSLKQASADGFKPVLENLGLIASYEGKLGSSNDARFTDLNDAIWADGALVFVPNGVEVDQPIYVVHFSSAGSGAHLASPRLLVVAERNARAKVVELHFGQNGTYLTNSVTELRLGEGASVEHVRVQLESPEAFHIATVAAHQESGSTYTAANVQLGSRIGRVDASVWSNGEHTETTLDGVYIGTGEQLLDNHTRIDHAKPNCHSFEVYKGILADKAHGVFNGKIFVYEDAQKTDAKQTNQALLLSRTAEVDTKPQLEIFADDVKCTHGATVGQLREDALFYLRQRGIPAEEARNILVYAFAAEVLEKITIPALREDLERLLFEKLTN